MLDAINQINRIVKLTRSNRKLQDSLRPGSQFELDLSGKRRSRKQVLSLKTSAAQGQ